MFYYKPLFVILYIAVSSYSIVLLFSQSKLIFFIIFDHNFFELFHAPFLYIKVTLVALLIQTYQTSGKI